jgi:hypothetical protein
MRPIALIAATALTALACALLPSGALAHGHHRGHHHALRARHHGRGLHTGLFGASVGSGSQQTQTGSPSSSGSPGGSGMTENVGPTSSTQQGNAGKIVSFAEGVLTIQLGEGEKATTISGKVTEETEIHCIPAPTSSSTPPSSSAPNPSEDDGGNDGEQGQQGESGWGHDDQGSGDDGEGDRNSEGGEHCQCSTANLTPGTVVHRAELLLTESGAVFREIVLVH